jgi:hypothetical protein
MYRSRSSSISYNILHGIHVPDNISTLLAYLSYFPPPPPVLPGPPPRRLWACSSHSLCLISNNYHLPALRQYNDYNQTKLLKNTSQISNTSSSSFHSISNYLIDLFHQKQFLFILLSVFILSLALVCIFSLILFVYFQRRRQRPTRTNDKNKKFYYNLIPHRTTTTNNNNNNEQKLVRLRKHSSTSQVIRIGGIHNNETEEAI